MVCVSEWVESLIFSQVYANTLNLPQTKVKGISLKATVKTSAHPNDVQSVGGHRVWQGQWGVKSMYSTHAYMYLPQKRTITYQMVLPKNTHNVKGIVDPNINLVNVYSPSCRSKYFLIETFFFCGKLKEKYWRMFACLHPLAFKRLDQFF